MQQQEENFTDFEPIKVEGGFLCPVCARVMPNIKDLKRHIMVHTGDKPYKCHLCDYAARQRGTLNRHLIRHEKQATNSQFVTFTPHPL